MLELLRALQVGCVSGREVGAGADISDTEWESLDAWSGSQSGSGVRVGLQAEELQGCQA